MNNILYSRILNSINKEIKTIIDEQFNIGDLDFSDDSEYNDAAIFNKDIIDPESLYDKVISNQLSDNEIAYLENFTSVIKIKNKYELTQIVEYYSDIYPTISLNYLDVSSIFDMSYLFEDTKYTGDISKWDVSEVIDMHYMFYNSKFNNDISQWDVSHVKNMKDMFAISDFNNDIS